MIASRPQRDVPQILFSVLLILTMLCCCVWIVKPFILSVIWAGLITIATWPLFTLLQRKIVRRRGVAILLMMLFLSAIFLLPVILSATAFTVMAQDALHWLMQLDMAHLPTCEFLNRIPKIGPHLHDKWLGLIHSDSTVLFGTLKPWLMKCATLLINELTHIGSLLVNGVLMLVSCLVFYLHGERIARGLRHFARRIAQGRGETAVVLAGKTIQVVAMGIVLTAVIQSAFAGIGLLICQIPAAALLTGMIFVLCLMQLGPVIVMLPAVAWLFWSGMHGMASLLLAWTVVAGALDNFIKPLLINRGADTSVLLIMIGVIGGMLAWGMIGLFIGPVLLAVSWRLLSTWVSEVDFRA